MAYSVRELFARLIKCEAGGEGENGMKAVAAVVMNRVHVAAGEYQRIGQGDLRKVLSQEGQFDCMTSILVGNFNPQTIWSNPPEQIHYDIADWALAGNAFSSIGEALWYFNPYQPVCPVTFPRNGSGSIINKINLHCFYIPTELYWET